MPTLYIADAERDADMKNLSRKEAAKVLEDMKSKGEIPKAAVTQWKRNTALDMAIEALKYSEVPNSSDCISRQAAIDAAKDWYEGLICGSINGLIKRLNALPTIQPEPKEGHWIKHESLDGGEQYECSLCGVLWEFNDGSPEDNEAYFCPKCGAKMTISTK